ncbi:hypothetical protein EG68_00105 [Paragonimus skrjabini miyazakii]|uniref:Uncharacterized protein n=1 Tax=Paragonimus skrjabini miyazakii TaxID=59628 RepID=A0A8S9Z537_9TREM|nr:hypothetical protein EG68_00105 [Paragonimus skrjabini miyazakii]
MRELWPWKRCGLDSRIMDGEQYVARNLPVKLSNHCESTETSKLNPTLGPFCELTNTTRGFDEVSNSPGLISSFENQSHTSSMRF